MATEKRAQGPKRKAPTRRRWRSWDDLVVAAVDAARDELRTLKAGVEPDVFDRWLRSWADLYGPAREEPAHAHVRALRKAIEAAIEYRAALGKTWDALEGADRSLHETLEEMRASALVARAFGDGGLRLPEPSRADIVDLAVRQGEAFTVRELALMSLVAGFAPKPTQAWNASRQKPEAPEPTPADVIALEAETMRRELRRQVASSKFAEQRAARDLVEGRPGRRAKKPT